MFAPTEAEFVQFLLSMLVVWVFQFHSSDQAPYYSRWFKLAVTAVYGARDPAAKACKHDSSLSMIRQVVMTLVRRLSYWLQVVALYLFLRFGESDGTFSFGDRIAYRAVVVVILVNLWLQAQYNLTFASRRAGQMLNYKGTALVVLAMWIMVTALGVSVIMFVHVGTRGDGNGGAYYVAPASLYTLYATLTIGDFYHALRLKDPINYYYGELQSRYAETGM